MAAKARFYKGWRKALFLVYMLINQEKYYQKIKDLNISHYSGETSYYSRAPLRVIEKTLLERLPHGSKILDLGCGSGRFSVGAALLGLNVTGADITPAAIACAREKAKKEGVDVTFLLADMTELPFEDNSFDFVFCPRFSINAVATLSKRKLAVNEMMRVVKPEGKIFIESFNKFYSGKGIAMPMRNLFIDLGRYFNIAKCYLLGKEYTGWLPGDLVYAANKVDSASIGYTHLPTIIEILSWSPVIKHRKVYSIPQIVDKKKFDIFKFLRYSIWIIIDK